MNRSYTEFLRGFTVFIRSLNFFTGAHELAPLVLGSQSNEKTKAD